MFPLAFGFLLFAKALAESGEGANVGLQELEYSTGPSESRVAEGLDTKRDFRRTVQERWKSRALLQETDGGIRTEDCPLTRREISILLDEATRTWSVDNVALEGVSNDISAIVNCTQENDIIFFRVESEIRVPARVMIPWNLTLSSHVEKTELADGVFPKASRRTRLRCPQNSGIFLIGSQNVLLANLVLQSCSLDTADKSIVEVGDCAPNSSTGTVRLHHVVLRRNTLNGASGFSAERSSCSSVEMVDVVFSDNTCGDHCFARLALENDLRNLVVRKNVPLFEEPALPSLILAPSGSSTSVAALTARSNRLSVLRVVEGDLQMTDSKIEKNSREPSLQLNRALGVSIANCSFRENSALLLGAGILVNATESLSVSNCTFASNSAATGAAIASVDSDVAVDSCSFRDNVATTDAGALFLSSGILELSSSVYQNNSASSNGGAVFVERSTASTISDIQCRNNSAGNGACLSSSACRELVIRRSSLMKNTANNGGALHFGNTSDAKIVDSVIEENTARDKGGGIFLSASPRVEVRNCSVKNNSASTGGGLDSRGSQDLVIRRCTIHGNRASLHGGGAWILDQSSVSVHASTWTANRAVRKAGGIGVEYSNLTSHASTYSYNQATEGAGLRIEFGGVDLMQDTVVGNRAPTSGGGMTIQHGRASIKDCHVEQNVGIFGGGVNVARAPTIIHNTTFVRNTAHTNRGGGLACYGSNMTITDSQFLSNKASSSGGAFHIVFCPLVTARNLTIKENQCDQLGGAIGLAEQSGLNISSSVIQFNSAMNGGAVHCRNSSVHVIGCSIVSNSAMRGAGVLVTEKASFFLGNSTVISNHAASVGGALASYGGSTVNVNATSFSNSSAQSDGGCIYGEESSVLEISDSLLSDSKSIRGGAIFVQSNTTVSVLDTTIVNSTAIGNGGGVFLEDSKMVANQTAFKENAATVGGSAFVMMSVLQLFMSTFEESRASRDGGSIAVETNSTVTVINTSISNSSATAGGAVWVSNSNLAASALEVRTSNAAKDGGAILANGSSTLLCSECMFHANVAGERGGAITFDTAGVRSLAFQLNDCSFEGNVADLGGAVHIAAQNDALKCSSSNASCAFVALTGSRFSKNTANTSGGAVFAQDPTAVRYSCSVRDTEVPPTLYTTDVFRALDVLTSGRDFCPDWTGNRAGRYGPTVASYARTVVEYAIDDEDTRDGEPVKGNRLVAKDHRSGDRLPIVQMEAMDGFGQGPPLGRGDAYVQATIRSPNGFFSGEVTMPLDRPRKRFPPISGLQRPGLYEIQIDFSEPGVERFTIEVEVRNCKLGEVVQEDGKLCVPCSGSQYNFNPNASECMTCPENANCPARTIQPNRGYWHRTPCSTHIERCVSREACDFPGREEKLSNATKSLESCEFDRTADSGYSLAQCKKGYTGILCGSCDAGYGRSRFDCDECYENSGTASLFVLSLLVLLLLSSFAIRSNLHSRSTDASFVSRVSMRSRRRCVSSRKSSTDVPVNYQMVEMLHSGHVPPEMVNPDILSSPATAKRPKTDPVVARVSIVEIFKITVNFLQVVASAVIVNANWTAWMRNLLTSADLLGGAATEGIVLSVDCLFAVDHDPPRSVIRSVIHFAVPLAIMVFYLALWVLLAFRSNKDFSYFAERALLSSLAVIYLAYLSITKTAVNALYCIDVHDSVDEGTEHKSSYWALDTSLKCYEGSHAVLASVIGWPVVITVSFGLPVSLAYVLLIKQRTVEPAGGSCIAEATGFLYRAYKERFIYWECVVMLRKSVLAVVVVFSYPLGVNIQGILAVCLLTLASYVHVCCQPFKEDFAFLNTFETSSLVVSQLTFASGLFFNDDRTSDAVGVLLTIILTAAICGLFLVFVYKLLKCSEVYVKVVLENEGMEDAHEWGMFRVLRIFLVMHIVSFYNRLCSKRDSNPPEMPVQ